MNIHEQGFASYSELKAAGIAEVINKGRNSWGFIDRTILLEDGSRWDYIPEDQIYELVSEGTAAEITPEDAMSIYGSRCIL